MTLLAESNVTDQKPVMAALAGKYLTFALAKESYGVPVLKVREIIRPPVIRSVPGLPPYMRGVINLRGKIIPVVDLRLRFNLGASECTEQACIVVVQVNTTSGITSMGLAVDGVEEVTQIAEADLEPTPDFGFRSSSGTECLLGMAKVKGVVKALLDIDRVIAADEVNSLPALT